VLQIVLGRDAGFLGQVLQDIGVVGAIGILFEYMKVPNHLFDRRRTDALGTNHPVGFVDRRPAYAN